MKPTYDQLPWACATCGGWVPPTDRLYTDEGLFHDRLTCLAGADYDELVERYGCRCIISATFTELEWIEHLEEEHFPTYDVGRVTEQERREATAIAAVLVPGQYDSDDLDRLVR